MAQTFPPSWQNCVTCERWGGPRRASTFRDQAEVDDPSATGECLGGAFDRMPMSAMQSCPQWKKWAVLQ
jgi:hypothetical protein